MEDAYERRRTLHIFVASRSLRTQVLSSDGYCVQLLGSMFKRVWVVDVVED